MKNKLGQVTIFIIVAVIIMAGVILFFLMQSKISIPGISSGMPNIQQEIEKCVKDSTLKAVNIMLPQAGYINPSNYKLYEDNKIGYLCYNQNYYYACINQEPMYLNHLQDEIKNHISPTIENCFNSLKEDYENKGYIVNFENTKLNIELKPKQIEINIDKKIDVTKNEDSRKYENFKVEVASPIYDLAVIAVEITNQESKYCNFEYLGFSLLYPDYLIEKKDINGETKIYSIKEKTSGKQLLIAIRSCAFPAGM